MEAVAFSSKMFRMGVPRKGSVSSLLSAQSHSAACQARGGLTGYGADAKQKVSTKEASSVKHVKGELTGVQAKY